MLDVAVGKHVIGQLHVARVHDASPHVEDQRLVRLQHGIRTAQRRQWLRVRDQVALLLIAMISSKGAAGVTGAGFITLAATLSIVPSVPVAGLALILGIDRFMSECRSLTNFIGNAVATIVVTRWEGALDKEQFDLAMAGQLPSIDRIAPSQIAA